MCCYSDNNVVFDVDSRCFTCFGAFPITRDLLRNLKRHKDEDFLKGQAVKNQKTLWDKTLDFRFLLEKSFSSSNRLPQEPLKSSFFDSDNGVKEAYSDLITSSSKTLDSLLELQEALLEKNPSIKQTTDETLHALKDEKFNAKQPWKLNPAATSKIEAIK